MIKSSGGINLYTYLAGMCRAELFPAGRGEDENPQGGPGRGGAKKNVNQLILIRVATSEPTGRSRAALQNAVLSSCDLEDY